MAKYAIFFFVLGEGKKKEKATDMSIFIGTCLFSQG